MKREIKFRAWLKAESKMCTVGLINFGTGAFLIGANPGADYFTSDGKSIVSAPIDGRFCNEGEYELIQFTGLKDKNGKEIYEGDIVKWFVNDVIRTGIVDYIDGYGGFDMKNFKDDYHVCCDWLRGEYEVIGNIYENPELQ